MNAVECIPSLIKLKAGMETQVFHVDHKEDNKFPQLQGLNQVEAKLTSATHLGQNKPEFMNNKD